MLPLGVRQEFKRDAVRLLDMPEPQYITATKQAGATGIYLTNYERVRDGGVNPREFDAVALDEASVLRSYGSKTFQEFMPMMRGIKYKLVATATPAPNKYKELIHYAGYLEVMDTGQALTRFFQRDSTKANNLTLYPHKEKEFWLWMSSWALFLTSPADLGFDATGYDLPPMDVRYHKLHINQEPEADRDGQIVLTRNAALSLPDASREKRDSVTDRIAKAKELVDSDPDAHFILWHDREDERHEIKRVFPEAVEVYGSQDYDTREQAVLDFVDGKTRLLATKKEISGQGCNFQRHCHRAIFTGIDFKFNDFIQAIHRIYRFLQTEQVIIDIIYTDNETEILRVLREKWEQHNEMVKQMTDIVKKYGLGGSSQLDTLARSIGIERQVIRGENFVAVNNDCVLETAGMAENSVDLIMTSIPFSNHYEYTPSYNDFGHNENTVRFFEQMDFLSPELLRVLRPGRVYACHVKDRVLFGNATGYGMPTMEPFHAMCIQHYMRHGFMYFGMITVTTDVVRENNQTYRLGWTEQCKDATKMGVGCPEYILLFRKLPTDRSKAYADVKVTKSKDEYTLGRWQIDAHGFYRTSGDRLLSSEELLKLDMSNRMAAFKAFSQKNVYDYGHHVQLADELNEHGGLSKEFMTLPTASVHPDVWDDIVRMNTLNKAQRLGRRELHVCPLQLDIIERVINRYTNSGETVYDPFGGIMSVPYTAVKMGRKGIGTELNPQYFKDGVGYLRSAEAERAVPTLFDFMDGEAV
ncbi:MAG TPA: DNA methyltransferase [Clostridia bacterium]|nr:DNA methyltransferase [Clostridia bacterium]